MASKSLFECCLSKNASGCPGDQTFGIDTTTNDYIYGKGCESLFGKDNNKQITPSNNYGYTDFIKQYPTTDLSDKYSGKDLFYALHATNDQINNNNSLKRNISTETSSFKGLYSENGSLAELTDIFTTIDICTRKPFRYYNSRDGKPDAPICYTGKNGSIQKHDEIKYTKEDVENGSDLCEYKIDSNGSLTDELESDEENCNKKYLEWSIDKFDDLGVSSSSTLQYYPSFTKFAKCSFISGSDGEKCSIKKSDNTKYVNECLEHTSCSEVDLYSNKCTEKEYSVDYMTENGGYNKQYTNLCGCKLDEDYYKKIQRTNLNKICKNYGLEGEALARCVNNLYKTDVTVTRSNNRPCIHDITPCNQESTIVKQDANNPSNLCARAKDDTTNYIQICSNVLNAKGVGEVDFDANNNCIQHIKDNDNTTYNNIIQAKEDRERGTNHTTVPPSTNTTTPPSDDSDFMTYIYYGLGIILVVVIFMLCIKLLFSKKEVTPGIESQSVE